MQIRIQAPLRADQEQIEKFFENVLTHTYKVNGISHLAEELKDEIQEKKEKLASHFRTNGTAPYFLVAKVEEKVVGTITLGKSNALIHELTKGKLDDVLELGTIYVDPSYQGNGIGSKLVKHMLSELQSKNEASFCLDSGFPLAQKVWRKKFGNPTYWFKNHWGEGSDHMVWHVTLLSEHAEKRASTKGSE
ncbi:GNAT family N-acetyltransferase [Paenisporosarcina cavernae]|uniref:N-acetyltransferase n=1 Tax=Paenisporosarcina cavernae TaxID=2320858 RepID=A0A385YUB7_9BACL|nr:GNAT family N-acetyltransferase [Paenisporosarcina cavernae]AYC30276.1 N-acetyltransferase [Paenisporosarcina cavernae]